MKKVIALLTDFGTRDPYVASMKGVIVSLLPDAKIIDISHEIDPHNIAEGAFILWQASRSFPKGTIFIGVVDPGVGSSRKILGVKTSRHIFLAPDNGLLNFVATYEKVKEIREVSNEVLFLKNVSATFHGRDILAPVAARLAKITEFQQIGPRLKPLDTHPLQHAKLMKNQIVADILYRDRFGNLITNIETAAFKKWRQNRPFKTRIGSKWVKEFYINYVLIPKGKASLIAGSSGFIEIACRQRSAADFLKVKAGYEFILTH